MDSRSGGRSGFVHASCRIVWLAALCTVLPGPNGAAAGVISGKVSAAGRVLTEAIVYVEEVPGAQFAPPELPVVVDQTRLEFVPRVLPILVGTTVEFTNSDVVLHSVFSPDECADRVDLGTWGKGVSRLHTFEEPCAAAMLCNIHPEMEGFVVALNTPYFAVSDRDGHFAIEGVPAGVYSVAVWHDRLSASPQQVVVPAEDGVAVEFELSR